MSRMPPVALPLAALPPVALPPVALPPLVLTPMVPFLVLLGTACTMPSPGSSKIAAEPLGTPEVVADLKGVPWFDPVIRDHLTLKSQVVKQILVIQEVLDNGGLQQHSSPPYTETFKKVFSDKSDVKRVLAMVETELTAVLCDVRPSFFGPTVQCGWVSGWFGQLRRCDLAKISTPLDEADHCPEVVLRVEPSQENVDQLNKVAPRVSELSGAASLCGIHSKTAQFTAIPGTAKWVSVGYPVMDPRSDSSLALLGEKEDRGVNVWVGFVRRGFLHCDIDTNCANKDDRCAEVFLYYDLFGHIHGFRAPGPDE